jgi:hypothetical protein
MLLRIDCINTVNRSQSFNRYTDNMTKIMKK